MKITAEDYVWISQRIALLDTKERRWIYKQSELSHKRYRWDLMSMAMYSSVDGVTAKNWDRLYSYLNDDHIDTALRRIVKEPL